MKEKAWITSLETMPQILVFWGQAENKYFNWKQESSEFELSYFIRIKHEKQAVS